MNDPMKLDGLFSLSLKRNPASIFQTGIKLAVGIFLFSDI
tara:strand:- start:1358 stop:1477 length:120 start_codon:yes stop_codon:yes gene_type:complete